LISTRNSATIINSNLVERINMSNYHVEVTEEIIKEYNDYRKTLGYPELTREEIENEFSIQGIYSRIDDPQCYSAQRYTKDENGNIIYDPNWEENLKRYIELE